MSVIVTEKMSIWCVKKNDIPRTGADKKHMETVKEAGDRVLREKETERKLVCAVKSMGGMALKLVSPSVDGLPDRLILLPGGKAGFVELKAKGKKPRALQVKRMNDLRALGFTVFVVDDKERIGGVLHAIQTT